MITSDSFPGDPYGWLTNQCGHGVLGLALAVYGDALGLWWAYPLAAAFLYWLLIEVLGQRLKLPADAFVDTVNVMAGATIPPALARGDLTAVGVLTVWGALLGIGYWGRM